MLLEYSRSPLQLVAASLRSPWIISIDGGQGAGKTTLAKEIGTSFAGAVIDVDDYLMGNGGPYLEQVQWELIIQDIQRNKGNKNLIISGVLLEYVMERVQIAPAYRIFMRHEVDGRWDYSDCLKSSVRLPRSMLSREITQYYRALKPWQCADEEVILSSRYVHEP
jgi:hypothetical protein